MNTVTAQTETRKLPIGVLFQAEVEGHTIIRTRSSWCVSDAAAIWAEVQRDVPTINSGRILHGSVVAARYTGPLTQAQLDEYTRRTQRLIRQAQKARKAVQA